MQNVYKTAAFVTVFSAFEHCLGFLYRIILSRILGSEGLGIYQASLTVFAVFLTISSSGLPITLSRTMIAHKTRRDLRGEQSATAAAILITLCVSVPAVVILFLMRGQFSLIFSDARCADLFYIFLLGLPFTSVYAVLRGNFWGNKRFFVYSLIELIEEMIMIFAGVFLMVFLVSETSDLHLAAAAVLISYLCSFSIAVVCFLSRGGKLRAPKKEIKPLLKSSLPITAMRTSSSLVNSLISVLFPARLIASGVSSSKAMSEYGVVYGMVMPVLMIPSTLISSIALVIVPELSECFYKKQKEKLSALVEKALNAALLVAAILIPFYIVCGEDVGILLYSNAASGKLIAGYAVMLVPMSLTMITASVLNSLQCERHTLAFFLLGSACMLLSVWFLPKYLGSGALLVGMACDYTVTAACALVLLYKKTGNLRSVRYFFKAAAAVIPVVFIGFSARKLFILLMGFLPAFLLTGLTVAAAECFLFAAFRLFDVRALIAKIFKTRRHEGRRVPAKKNAPRL